MKPAPQEPSRLKGQVALVTGGGRGIGRAIAQTLAAEGAAVAVLARSAGELDETVRHIEKDGNRALSISADVTNEEAVRSAIKTIEEKFGAVDLLVNNAGTPKPLSPLWESDVSEWWRGMEVNLLGPALCSRFVLPGMVARKRGRIINIVSGAGTTAMTNFSSYVCSKTALIRFTECLALESKPYGVSIFSVAPGTVKTAMSEYSLNSEEGKRWLPWFKRLFDEEFTVPVEQPAKLVLELASGRADTLSGRLFSVQDDLEQLLANALEIEQRNLYALKIERISNAPPNQALASILAASRKAVD